MKTRIFIITTALLCLYDISIIAQQYQPIPDSNASWKVYWSPYPPDEPWTARHYNYISSGDTVIDTIKYTKLLKIDYDLYCSKIADTNFIGAYRNDIQNKIVYFRQDNGEKILYNFSLEIGDTIPTSYYIETDGVEMVVCNIDSIQLETGEFRKQFTYEFPNQSETCVYKVVEGIGFLGGLLEPMSIFAELINSSLICFNINDSIQYLKDWYDKCEIVEDTCITSFIPNNISSSNILKIIPNPVVGSSIIGFNNPVHNSSDYSLSVYDLMGRKAKSYYDIYNNNTKINNDDFNEGIYIFVVRRNNIIEQTGKLLIKQ